MDRQKLKENLIILRKEGWYLWREDKALEMAELDVDEVLDIVGLEEQKLATLRAMRRYHSGYISGEKCAELVGMNAYEFYELLRKIDMEENNG